MHITENLWREMSKRISPFPQGVADVPEPIKGTAFFPGGFGLWSTEDDPRGQIAIVGQDFNSTRTYKQALADGTEIHSSATWRELQKILPDNGISPRRCFFTNVYMGLRDGGKETGPFPGLPGICSTREFKDFSRRSLGFFLFQLEFSRPRLILTLGLEPIRALAHEVFHIPKPSSMTEITEIYREVRLPYGHTTLVALTHPSFYGRNVGNRRYGVESGKKAENAMIADGLKAASLG
jgi:uracil-DNA glycosylase